MIKRFHPLILSAALITLLLAGCNRFFGTPPIPVATDAPVVETAAPPREPTATIPPVVLPPEGRRATVSEVVNVVEAKVVPAAGFQPVQDGAVIGVGGQVRTGAASRARVDLSEDTVVRLGADTVFTVEALTDSGGGPFMLVRLDLGRLWASLTGGSLQVITPVGVASVRGSFAIFEYNPGNPDDPTDDMLILDCIEGECSLQNGAVDEQAGNLERIVLDGGGQITRVTLTGEDVQNFIANNPDVGEAISATLTAAAPPPEATPTDTSAPPEQATPTAAPPASTPVPVLGRHVLLGGETLFCIGRAYGVLPSAIAEANGLDTNGTVFAGQTLIIPAVRWFNIPAGPVCPRQFNSPFPGLQPAAPSPTTDAAQPSDTPSGPAPTATDTVVPTPVCAPPEYFDPLMNRCRRPEDSTPYQGLPIDQSPLYQSLAKSQSAPPVSVLSGLLGLAGLAVAGWYRRRDRS